MFQDLSEKFARVFKELRGHGKVREVHIQAAMKEVRRALLEADVNYKVVKGFIANVSERALGEKVLDSLTPDQQIIKIVHEELISILGGGPTAFTLSGSPAGVMVCGLQGAGKTSFTAKLAVYLRKKGRNPLLVAADIYRPAAVQQLEVLGREIDTPVFAPGIDLPVEEIVRKAVIEAKKNLRDTIIVDTAGRLHIDGEMMDELSRVKEILRPEESLLVLDSMTGQEAVTVAREFKKEIDFTGVVLTKLDGDTRGGAALSVSSIARVPIKFVCVGERTGDLEAFFPDRMAGRILGMGDILSLVEKAQDTLDEKKIKELESKLLKEAFTLEDFLDQLQRLKKMGPVDQILGMVPGMKLKGALPSGVGEKEMKKIEAIIQSMTPLERRSPQLIGGSRRRRIANGSGSSVQDVNRLLNQFQQMKKMMKRFSKAAGKMPAGFPHSR
ncbi:MAG: signal recognition particle protein [Candidatus Krumholzibacteriota bacterium]|nr:signal recognition particle protein [Candidatus Krumholzibacteriota bacterium]